MLSDSTRQARVAVASTCAICLFGVFTVSSVLHDPQWPLLPRDLDLVELWTEVETLVRAARDEGLQAEGFDILQDASNDITTYSGFSRALKMVMRVKPGGLVAMAPDCSSFGFGPSSVSGRAKANLKETLQESLSGPAIYRPPLLLFSCTWLLLEKLSASWRIRLGP